MAKELIVGSRRGTQTREYEVSEVDLALDQSEKSAQAARLAQLRQRLADIPSNVNSVPALRAEVNVIKEFLRDTFGA